VHAPAQPTLEVMTTEVSAPRVPYVYGHGTENDFILVFDPDNQITPKPDQIASACNRETGIGADGLIRIVKASGGAEWFMDYYNADGSIAEMCGNGIRVMARFLRDRDLIGDTALIDTRDGIKEINAPKEGDISVEMGRITTAYREVEVTSAGGTWSAIDINVGNPHAVAFVDDLDKVGSLAVAPSVTPENAFPDGVNVEFVVEHGRSHVAMRVHERGSGETRSCGTGCCAVAFATALRHNVTGASNWTVDVPGGRVRVDLDANGYATLIGPAVLLREGDLELG
jgi:diaminopimelate epimerase